VLVSVFSDVEVTSHAKGTKGAFWSSSKRVVGMSEGQTSPTASGCSVLESDTLDRHVGLV
jgi:hypothetical protein